MDSNESLAKIICEQLEHNSPVVLATIVAQQGSSPRHLGTKMVIDAAGEAHGTIGGSMLEVTTIKKALGVIDSHKSQLLEFDLNNQNVYVAGMICGGNTTVLLDYISPCEENRELWKIFYSLIKDGTNFSFLTLLKSTDSGISISGHFLVAAGEEILGQCHLSSSELNNLKSELRKVPHTDVIPFNEYQVVVDNIQKTTTLYCCGAGHVALPTARLATQVGFRVIVIDSRPELTGRERFPEAAEIRVINNYENLFNKSEIDASCYIIILTHSHIFDRGVLKQALQTNARYIGMISSRKKRDAVYAALLEEGICESALKKVHSPIGLDIGAETPEEIAVSIIAELIQERSGKHF